MNNTFNRKNVMPSNRCHSDNELAGGQKIVFHHQLIAIKLSNMEHWHTYYQPKCNITNNLWNGDAYMMEVPLQKYSDFSLWEINVLERIYKDLWGLSLMEYLRTVQDLEVKSIFEIQRYLDSIEAIDIRRRKEFHKKTLPA